LFSIDGCELNKKGLFSLLGIVFGGGKLKIGLEGFY
jgi:hypothetical protein